MKLNWTTALATAALFGAVLILQFPSMRNVVDLIIGTAWPISALIAVWWFRDEIKRLLERLKKIGKGGAEFDQQLRSIGDPSSPGPIGTTPLGPTESAPRDGGALLAPDQLVAMPYRPLVAQFVTRVNDRLPEARQKIAGSDTEILKSWGAEVGAALLLERASRFIFQSQTEALDTLKATPALAKESFRPFYDKAVQQFPSLYSSSAYSFDQWFNFLSNTGLVAVTPDGAVTVTPAGQVASLYMAELGYGRGAPA